MFMPVDFSPVVMEKTRLLRKKDSSKIPFLGLFVHINLYKIIKTLPGSNITN